MTMGNNFHMCFLFVWKLQNNYGYGTLQKNKAQIPPMLLYVIKTPPVESSIFLYGDKKGKTSQCLLPSYVPKENIN